jgi:trehalose-6-phosphatase
VCPEKKIERINNFTEAQENRFGIIIKLGTDRTDEIIFNTLKSLDGEKVTVNYIGNCESTRVHDNGTVSSGILLIERNFH